MATNSQHELSSCGLCHQLSEKVRPIKVTYHICDDCELKDYEIVRKGQKPLTMTTAIPQTIVETPATYTPPPRVIPPHVMSALKLPDELKS